MPSYLLKKLGIVVFSVNLTKTSVNAAFMRDYFQQWIDPNLVQFCKYKAARQCMWD